MKREFLADPQYNFETVNHASTACGPLVQWAIAQVRMCIVSPWRPFCLKLLALSGAKVIAQKLSGMAGFRLYCMAEVYDIAVLVVVCYVVASCVLTSMCLYRWSMQIY